MEKLTHIDEKGEVRMVDVSAKPDTERIAVAEGFQSRNLCRNRGANHRILVDFVHGVDNGFRRKRVAEPPAGHGVRFGKTV